MIEFQHKLPAMNIDGKHNGTYNNYELGMPSVMTTTDYKLGVFIDELRNAIFKERSLVFIDHEILLCGKNWIRDHTHVMKAMRHWEHDIRSFLDFIIRTQRADGQFYELIKQYDDIHWTFVDEDCYVLYPEDNLTLVRLELEADVEYLVVECAMYVYHAMGDDAWLSRVLPALERGIDYITSDPIRWDAEHGLVKRPATIDTWDFTADVRTAHDRRIHPETPMSIMHGDNTGVYQAMRQLAWMRRRLGDESRAAEWDARAERLRENIMTHLWNGSHFIHQLHLGHRGVDDLENVRLSLSNAYALNRGIFRGDQARRVIEAYRSRRGKGGYFAEWYTIDPPYEKFGNYTPGRYVNGAISPFTAGELARGAFWNGYEEYGWEIICQFIKLVERDHTVHFLYDVDSAPQPQGGPSAWGAAALICAVDEGLAGIVDRGVRYDEMDFAPRFPVTHYTELRYLTGYEQSKTLVDIRYILTDEGMRYDIYAPSKTIFAHILLPKGRVCQTLLVDGVCVPFESVTVGCSHYVDRTIAVQTPGYVRIEVLFER